MFVPDFNLTKSLLEYSDKADEALIKKTIDKEFFNIEDFSVLISKNITKELIKKIAKKSFALTRKRFGFALSLYAPLYYDNRCTNGCTYCGFSAKNKIERRALSFEEIIEEAKVLRNQKFKNILLVAGEHPESSNTGHLENIIKALHKLDFSCVSIEIAPLSTEDYKKLVDNAHLDGLYIYQETYNPELYKKVHLFGKKSDYNWRLETAERGSLAGIRKIGIGFLLGLGNWREEVLNLAQHLLYLQKHNWNTEYSISFPRIRNAKGLTEDFNLVSDIDFINLFTSLRLIFPETAMSLSTREIPDFRDKIIPLGFTNLSAGSSTAPGGYSKKDLETLEQFEVEDSRTPEEIEKVLKAKNFDPVWKDWE